MKLAKEIGIALIGIGLAAIVFFGLVAAGIL